jgi:hypothetical protein
MRLQVEGFTQMRNKKVTATCGIKLRGDFICA